MAEQFTDSRQPEDAFHPPLNPQLLFQPSTENIQKCAMERFRETVNKKYSINLTSYNDLYRWSCTNLKEFWSSVWEYTHVISSQPYMQVINENVPIEKIPEWFVGARLNFAENLLRYTDDKPAIIATGESGQEKIYTYQDLNSLVSKCAAALKKSGVNIGDRVVAYVPNCVEAVVGMLGAASIGAIWSSTSPDFGVTGVLDRFVQVKPKVLFSVNAVMYNGKVHEHFTKLKSVAAGLPTVQKVVVIDFISGCDGDVMPSNWVKYDDFLESSSNSPLKFEQLSFNHPLYILYSSGTTGLPKCIVHSAGGTLIQHLKEHVIHGDLTRDDVFFQYTTTGWMMWNWLVSALATGCTIVLYDGSPFKPNDWILWELADKYRFTKFGTSAKYIQSMQEMAIHPAERFKLDSLNEIYSTGSPLKPDSFDFIYQHVKKEIFLSSITGGTDIVSLFAGHNHTLPVYRGEIVSRCLGMAIETWDNDGKHVEGVTGDLVCTKPFPCMPVFFWNDEDHAKYRDAYFAQFPGVWFHGDFVWLNPTTGGLVMLGRSDGTLKPAGVRFGSAELYNVVERYFSKEIKDSLAVGQRRPEDKDERVVLFLKLNEGYTLSEDLISRIKTQIRKELSPRHVPAFILETKEIPYTVNGKKVEIAVKKIISGQTVVPSATLANPESLALYENIVELSK